MNKKISQANDKPQGFATSYLSILLLILKEIRLERGIHQAVYAQMAGKTPNTWSKIENGHSPLPMEAFLNLCTFLGIMPSIVMATTERYAQYLSNISSIPEERWAVLNELDIDKDDLLRGAREYYNSPGFKMRPMARGVQALNTLIYTGTNPSIVLEVFYYNTNKVFKQQQDDINQPPPPPPSAPFLTFS